MCKPWYSDANTYSAVAALLSAFTTLIAYFISREQREISKAATRASEQAARAADQSVLTMQRAERAYVRPLIEILTISETTISIRWRIENYGRSAAYLLESTGTMLILDLMDDPAPTPEYSGTVRTGPFPPLEHGAKTELEIVAGRVGEFERVKLEVMDKYLFFFGYIRFRDIYERNHTQRFGVRVVGDLSWRVKPNQNQSHLLKDKVLWSGPATYHLELDA